MRVICFNKIRDFSFSFLLSLTEKSAFLFPCALLHYGSSFVSMPSYDLNLICFSAISPSFLAKDSGYLCDINHKAISHCLFHFWLQHHFLQAQDQCIPMSKESSKGARRPTEMRRELLPNLKEKKKIYGMCKKGQATWDIYRNKVRGCREPMPICNLIYTGKSRTARRATISTLAAKRKPGTCRVTAESDGCPGEGGQREGRITECLLSFSVSC